MYLSCSINYTHPVGYSIIRPRQKCKSIWAADTPVYLEAKLDLPKIKTFPSPQLWVFSKSCSKVLHLWDIVIQYATVISSLSSLRLSGPRIARVELSTTLRGSCTAERQFELVRIPQEYSADCSPQA